MATYLDSDKHSNEATETTISKNSFKVTLVFESVSAKNPLEAAQEVAKWCKENADEMVFNVEDESGKIVFVENL